MEQDDAARDKYSAELGDWRIANAGWIEAFDGVPVPADKPSMFHTVSLFKDNWAQHSFITPNAAALHLNSAWRAARRASSLKTQLTWATTLTPVGLASHQMGYEGAPVLFDFFEESMATLASSCAAIEAFCNGELVQAGGEIDIKGKKGRPKRVPAEEAERRALIEEKLGRLVPDLLGVPSPAGKAVWQQFQKIKELRDSTTHFKRRDQAKSAGMTHEPTALLKLIRLDPYEAPETAMAVVGYFFRKGSSPRWLRNPTWAREPQPPSDSASD